MATLAFRNGYFASAGPAAAQFFVFMSPTRHWFPNRSAMRICSLLVGLVAGSLASVSQETGTQAIMTRVYDGKDYGSYYLDPPYWSYHPKRFWKSNNAHWLFRNHRYVFLDIRISDAGSQ
jgi:hypothetical protein